MNFLRSIKDESQKHYAASNGVTFILQRVNTTNILISSMTFADIKAISKLNKVEGKTNEEIMDAFDTSIPIDPKLITKTLDQNKAILEKGVVAIAHPDGSIEQIIWTSKSSLELKPDYGETNVELWPEELVKELLVEIKKIGKPDVEGQDVSTFPKEPAVS
ncbi:MAG: hypothetical protein ACRC4U_01620 [Shewanella sp.]